jgi:hypothetical protein
VLCQVQEEQRQVLVLVLQMVGHSHSRWAHQQEQQQVLQGSSLQQQQQQGRMLLQGMVVQLVGAAIQLQVSLPTTPTTQ